MNTHVRGDFTKRLNREQIKTEFGVLWDTSGETACSRCLSPLYYLIRLTFQLESNPLPCCATNSKTLEGG